VSLSEKGGYLGLDTKEGTSAEILRQVEQKGTASTHVGKKAGIDPLKHEFSVQEAQKKKPYFKEGRNGKSLPTLRKPKKKGD